MAVNKRLRWQIFRRDNFACQYCGITAMAGGVLEVDHVDPRARGGKDAPTNLITACESCNSGKSDIPMNAPLVAGVPQAAFQIALAERHQQDDEAEDEPDPREEPEWVHDLEISVATRWYSEFPQERVHTHLIGRFVVTFALAAAAGYGHDELVEAAAAAGMARSGDLLAHLPEREDLDGPEELHAYEEARRYLAGFIAAEIVGFIWCARSWSGDYIPTPRQLVRAAARAAAQHVEEYGRDVVRLKAWLDRLPNGEGSRRLYEATKDWDDHWKGAPGHAAAECPGEVLVNAVSIALASAALV